MDAGDKDLNVKDAMLVVFLECIQFLIEPEGSLRLSDDPNEIDFLDLKGFPQRNLGDRSHASYSSAGEIQGHFAAVDASMFIESRKDFADH